MGIVGGVGTALQATGAAASSVLGGVAGGANQSVSPIVKSIPGLFAVAV
jgi:hypothetical protein